jgi:hypothetical protein
MLITPTISFMGWRVWVFCLLVSLRFCLFISNYYNFLAECIPKLILSIKAMVRRIVGQITVNIFMIFYIRY